MYSPNKQRVKRAAVSATKLMVVIITLAYCVFRYPHRDRSDQLGVSLYKIPL